MLIGIICSEWVKKLYLKNVQYYYWKAGTDQEHYGVHTCIDTICNIAAVNTENKGIITLHWHCQNNYINIVSDAMLVLKSGKNVEANVGGWWTVRELSFMVERLSKWMLLSWYVKLVQYCHIMLKTLHCCVTHKCSWWTPTGKDELWLILLLV